jgi:hypothetical protein
MDHVKEMRAAGSARTDGSAPLSRGEFALDKQRIPVYQPI